MVELRSLKEVLVSQEGLGRAVLLVDSHCYAVGIEIGLAGPPNCTEICLPALERRMMTLMLQVRAEI
jgi:hypothetical protein